MSASSRAFAAQTLNSSNSSNNSKCQDNNSAGNNGNSGTVSTSSSGNAASANNQYPLPKFDSCNFGNESIDNPYFTLAPGATFTYQTKTQDGTEKDVVMVTDKTKEILGIRTTVVWDRVWLDQKLSEETFDWHAQDKQGNVWYMGEDSKEYQKGKAVNTEGSWEAGVNGAKPGIIMKADPQVGDSYRQEYYPGHAEDAAKVISLNETVKVPFGTFTNCLQTRDVSLIEPNQDENKYYCTGMGGVALEVAIDSGERTELTDFQQSGNSSSSSSSSAESPSTNNSSVTGDTVEQGDNDANDNNR